MFLGKFKIPDLVLFAAVFLVLFFIGFMGGRSISMVTLFKDDTQQDNLADPAFGNRNGQWNLLIIAVDHLTASRPALAGIWLLITTPENQNLTLVPIFPTMDPETVTEDSEWEKIFSLTSDREVNVEFMQKISEQVLWDEYLLIDKDGMSSIGETVGLHDVSSKVAEVPDKKNGPHPIGTEFDLSLESQIDMWKTICLELSKFTEPEDIAQFLSQIKPHLATNFNIDEVAKKMYLKNEPPLQLGCEFPTLTLKSP